MSTGPNILAPVTAFGAATLRLLGEMGAMFLFLADGLRLIFASPKQIPKILNQVFVIGSKSLFVILLIGVFTGMVLGLQGRELGPVLTAIMVTGRAGSSMAAEIGVMRITDQIDALDVMDINPMAYLVAPRIAASLISFPLLTAVFDVVGILGGYVTGVTLLGINEGVYFYRIESSVEMADITGGFMKSLLFAVIVATVSCYQGYFTHMRRDGVGPEGVSNSTTSAVVLSCVFVLVADYVLTSFLL